MALADGAARVALNATAARAEAARRARARAGAGAGAGAGAASGGRRALAQEAGEAAREALSAAVARAEARRHSYVRPPRHTLKLPAEEALEVARATLDAASAEATAAAASTVRRRTPVPMEPAGAGPGPGAAAVALPEDAGGGAALLWKTSRGPTATRPRPRRRTLLLIPSHDSLVSDTSSPIAPPPPTRVLYALPLARDVRFGRDATAPPVSLGAEAPADEADEGPGPGPLREDAAAAEGVARGAARGVAGGGGGGTRRRSGRTHWASPAPRVVHRRPVLAEPEPLEAYVPAPKERRRSQQVADDEERQLREVDYEAGGRPPAAGPGRDSVRARPDRRASQQPAAKARASPDDDEDHRTLLARGREAYRRLMARETNSTRDIYKMMLDLAWRHRNDKVPPPLPPPPPPPPPATLPQSPLLHMLHLKSKPLPPRPPPRPEPVASDDAFYTGRGGRVRGQLRAALGLEPRASALLDPASWAPPPNRHLADPRAAPPPGRVPRGWINIMEIGVTV